MESNEIGFVGLGAMGVGLALNLQKILNQYGKKLKISNRSKNKAEVERLLKEGAVWCDSPAVLATECDITFSMLGTDFALEEVFKSYLSGNPKAGSIFVDCSTVYPDLAEKLEAQAQAAGLHYLTSPVFGRPDIALSGKALIVSAGDPVAKSKVRPYQEAMGRGILDVGDSARLGNVMKLVGNFFIMSMTELIAEGMTLADKNGIQRAAVLNFLRESFPGPITTGYAERVARDEFKMTPEAPGFSAKGGMKDVSHVRKLGEASGVGLPVADIVAGRLKELVDRGGGDSLDWGSSALLLREAAGIPDPMNLLQPKNP